MERNGTERENEGRWVKGGGGWEMGGE
jgi:hypothetical protein